MSYKLDTTTPFYKELTDEDAYFQFNGNAMQRAMYNLYVSKRDIGLNAIGMKPHSNWRVRDVKTYFGIKGNKKVLLDNFMKLFNHIEMLREQQAKDYAEEMRRK